LIEAEVIQRFEPRIKELLEEKIAIYSDSNEFKALLEEMKRKKREEMLSKIDEDIKAERESFLAAERAKAEKEAEEQRRLEEVMEENRRKVEEQRRVEAEEKAKQDEQKLMEIQRRQQHEEEEQRQRMVSVCGGEGG
jgi:hypothetical protein